MVVCDSKRESDPDRTRDECRLLLAWRALPDSMRADVLRNVEVKSFNFARKLDQSTPGGDHA